MSRRRSRAGDLGSLSESGFSLEEHEFMRVFPIAARVAAYGTLAAIALVAACSDVPLRPGDAAGDAAVTPVSDNSTAERRLPASHHDRLDEIKRRTSWVGEAHHEGMKVLIRHIAEDRKARRPVPRPGTRAYCALLEQVGEATIAVLDSGRSIRSTKKERLARVRRDYRPDGCPQSLSVFAAAAAPARTAAQEPDPEVSGAYELYLDQLETAVANNTSSVGGVQSAVDQVLLQAMADGIPEGDLLALGSFGSLAVSSAAEWHAYDWSGAGACTDSSCNVWSVFAPRIPRGKVGAVIAADVGGCLASAKGWGKLKMALAAPAWKALAGQCGVSGAIASGSAVLAFI